MSAGGAMTSSMATKISTTSQKYVAVFLRTSFGDRTRLKKDNHAHVAADKASDEVLVAQTRRLTVFIAV